MLNAFYDFAVSPAKHDFVSFMLDAERFRRLTGWHGINFIFVPGPAGGFREDKLPPRDPEVRRSMFMKILVPMTKMLECQTKVTICQDREQALALMKGEIFPTEYTVKVPTMHYGTQLMMRAFMRGEYPFVAPLKMHPKPDLITITLRETDYWDQRNSNRETWLAAAEAIKSAGLRVLFIPDTHSAEIVGWKSDKEATYNLLRRVAIYDAAAYNLFVANGPACIAMAMKSVNGIMFKVLNDAPATSASFYTGIGFPPGSQIGRDNFNLVWEDDTKEVVLPEVERVVRLVKGKS